MGRAFENLFGEAIHGAYLTSIFTMIRPGGVELGWKQILEHSSSVVYEFENKISLKNGATPETKLRLKGQMKIIPELEQIFFLGHPMLNSLEDLNSVGLYLNDLNKFDGSGEMLVVEEQHNRQLQKAFQTQHAWTEKLEKNRTELKTWKKRSRKLLYSLLPARIAIQIENGVQPNTICESFSQVTIMFINTVDFNSLVNNSEPGQIVNFINSTVNIYDRIVATYDRVHKIETKADGSYMVVAGIDSETSGSMSAFSMISNVHNSMTSVKTPDDEPNVIKRQFPEFNQVELISAVALEILENANDIHNPFVNPGRNENLKIKIGFHTGPIVAGIVGLHNIQFCLFGDTVNTASRMCSNSHGGKVLVSQVSGRFLERSKYFELEFRDFIEVKGKGSMKTFWLKGKKESTTNLKVTEKTSQRSSISNQAQA